MTWHCHSVNLWYHSIYKIRNFSNSSLLFISYSQETIPIMLSIRGFNILYSAFSKPISITGNRQCVLDKEKTHKFEGHDDVIWRLDQVFTLVCENKTKNETFISVISPEPNKSFLSMFGISFSWQLSHWPIMLVGCISFDANLEHFAFIGQFLNAVLNGQSGLKWVSNQPKIIHDGFSILRTTVIHV